MSDKDHKAKLPRSARDMPLTERLATIRGLEFGADLDDAVIAKLAEQSRVVEFRREGIRERERKSAAEFDEKVDETELAELVRDLTTPGSLSERSEERRVGKECRL